MTGRQAPRVPRAARQRWAALGLSLGLLACSEPAPELPPAEPAPDAVEPPAQQALGDASPRRRPPAGRRAAVFPRRQAYFGDLHVHTAGSLEAGRGESLPSRDDAYRYARGQSIEDASGSSVRLRAPLDFVAITDRAEGAGPGWWQGVISAAGRYDEPNEFTTFIAYEWSANRGGANLHRNVIFAGSEVPEAPFTADDSGRPEDLWTRLEAWREQGSDVIAIPHNGNASRGRMYPLVDSAGRPVDAEYAARRMRNEPVSEVTQLEGSSETHVALSPRDEFADFELWNTLVGSSRRTRPDAGSYVRSAYLRGLLLQARGRGNPYAFSLIGSSDSIDTSLGVEEWRYAGGGNADALAGRRRDGRLPAPNLRLSASGLAGVWASANTRESIFAALQRGETFATSGPRIQVRLFAGVGYPEGFHRRKGAVEQAYAYGVPMGGRLPVGPGETPTFAVWGIRDPHSAPLERVQIIKGFLRRGRPVERIYDVVCSDGILPDPDTHRCPDNGATLDLATCRYSPDVGNGQLATTWTDPDYAPGTRAVYYARVLENPSCRWTTWKANRQGTRRPRSVPASLRERAWSSPIWVEPADR